MQSLQRRSRHRALLLFGAVGVLLSGLACSRALTAEEYMEWFHQNQTRFTREFDDGTIKAEVCALPMEYLVARELAANPERPLANVMGPYVGSIFVQVAIDGKACTPGERPLDVSGAFVEDKGAVLVCEGDTVSAGSHLYDRGLGLDCRETHLYGFSRDTMECEPDVYTLLIRDISRKLGTVEIELNALLPRTPSLKG